MPMAATSNSRLLTDASASALMILASFLGMPYHRHLCWIHIPCESRRPNSALLTNVHLAATRPARKKAGQAKTMKQSRNVKSKRHGSKTT
jgi:hypothetical protein